MFPHYIKILLLCVKDVCMQNILNRSLALISSDSRGSLIPYMFSAEILMMYSLPSVSLGI